jgi:outer membrane protein assembly factor BamE (lipoprotein component of BamABCDE complex)
MRCGFDAGTVSRTVETRMKIPTSFALACLLAIASGLTGCATSTTPMNRIDANRAEYETWPIEVKQAVLDGRVEKGMTPKQVEVAIGEPSSKEIRDTRKGTQEVWVYKTKSGGGNPLKGSSVSIGTYGVGVQTAPIGTSDAYAETYEVVFENDRVTDTTGTTAK